MASDRRFTWVALAWTILLTAGIAAATVGVVRGAGAATLIVTGALAVAAFAGLIAHVERTNVAVARFVEAVRFRDASIRVGEGGGAGFGTLGAALNAAIRALHDDRQRDAAQIRFHEALTDDLPVAILLVDADGVRLANKAARRLFDRHPGAQPSDFGIYGEALAECLRGDAGAAERLVTLALPGGSQRAIVHVAGLARLGGPVRIVAVEPVQRALDVAEVGAQADLVRVLAHEILNSLTPVVSLAGTATVLLGEDPPDLAEARLAVETLARRAEATRRFIDSYRAIATAPEPRRRRFAAQPFAAELARLFAVEWVDHRLVLNVPADLMLDADPDLLAQALINLLRNAAQASEASGAGRVSLRMARDPAGATIAVEDDGPGIPAALHGDVFLPFFTTRSTGSGIGLNLVRQIAIAHRGGVEIGSGTLGGALIRLTGF